MAAHTQWLNQKPNSNSETASTEPVEVQSMAHAHVVEEHWQLTYI